MGNVMMLSIIIRARDEASSALARIGMDGAGAFGPLGIAAAGVLAGIGAIGIVSLHAAAQFDLLMTKVQALTVVTGAGNDTMAYYRQQILLLSGQVGVSADSLAEGLYFVKSAGFNGAAAMDVLRYSAMTARAGMVDLKGVADAVTSALNAYKGAGLTAGEVTDYMHLAVVNGKMEWGDLVTSFGFTATTARAAGLSIQEVAAAVSTLTAVSGHHGARRIQMELNNLMRSFLDIKAVEKRAKGLHVMFDPAKFATKTFIEKLQYLAKQTGFSLNTLAKLKAESKGNEAQFEKLALAAANSNSAFMKMTGGAAAFIPAAILLSDGGKSYNTILAQMHTHGEVTKQSFSEMATTLTQKMQAFGVSLQSIAITIGEQLMPYAQRFAGALGGVATQVLAWLNNTAGMTAFKYALLGIAIIATAILVPGLIAAATAAAPFILATVAIVGGGLLLGRVIQMAVAHFGGWSGVLKQIHPLLKLLGDLLKVAGDQIRIAFANPAIHQALARLQAALPQLLPVLKILGVLVLAIGVGIGAIVVIAVIALAKILPTIITEFTDIIGILGTVGQLIVDLFQGKWNKIGPDLLAIGQAISRFFLDLGNQALGWGKNLIQMLINGIKNMSPALAGAAMGALKGIKNWLGFHSPAPNVPESALWGANLISMFAASMTAAMPTATAAAQALVASLGGVLGGAHSASALALTAAGRQVAGSAGAALAAAGGGAAAPGGAGSGGVGGVHYHTWNLNFPNATDQASIKKAIQDVQDERERDDARRARRPGSYGGLRSGLGTF